MLTSLKWHRKSVNIPNYWEFPPQLSPRVDPDADILILWTVRDTQTRERLLGHGQCNRVASLWASLKLCRLSCICNLIAHASFIS